MSTYCKPVAALGASSMPTTYHRPYPEFPLQESPYGHADSEESLSDAGSVGPEEFFESVGHDKHYYATSWSPQQASLSIAEPKTEGVTPVRPSATRAAMASVDLWAQVMTYLPLEDIERARTLSAVTEAAANRVAPRPLGTDDAVFIRWEPQEVHTAMSFKAKGRVAPAALPAVFPWRCLSCGHISAGPRACQHCRAPLAASACRVFLGQLRKDLSAELAMAMVRCLAPEVTVLHMESHTNAADGRGKGCAWAYVNSVEDAVRLTQLHKRVFVDLDDDNGEGYWYIKDPSLVPRLGAMAEVIAAKRSRPLWLPRQPLVAELPSKSMIAEYVSSF